MKILIFGSSGQLAKEIKKAFTGYGKIKTTKKSCLNFRRPTHLVKLINDYKPNLIINCVAYTNVERSEHFPKIANDINCKAVGYIARAAKINNSTLIHFSTDFIFDGLKETSYKENDNVSPLSNYGISKYNGELEIKKSKCKSLIFRTSWVYSLNGNNFLNKVLSLASHKKNLKIINNIYGVPTSAEMIAKCTLKCFIKIKKNKYKEKDFLGTYNLVPSGSTSLYKLSIFLINEVKKNGYKNLNALSKIEPISQKKFKSIVKRPMNSKLNNDKISRKFNIKLPHWKKDVIKFAIQKGEGL